MNVQEKILLEENEIKPNKHAANTLLCAMLAAAILLLMTELNLFRVSKSTMRPCLYLVILATALMQPLGRKLRFSSEARTKYIMVSGILLCSQVVMLALGQFAELILLFPVIFSAQYHNKGLCWYALSGTLLMAFVSAPVSCLLGLTRVSYYTFLIEACGQSTVTAALENYDAWEYAKLLMLYVSLPRMLICSALGVVVFATADLDNDNIHGRISATYYSSVDILTGLYNRFSFEKQVEEYIHTPPAELLCVYADADGLHNLNNREGHMAGDAFLKACAQKLREKFGELSYRIGGDEFLVFVETAAQAEAERLLVEINEELERWDYHMSFGFASLQECPSGAEELVRLAESRMSANKKAYHEQFGMERD